MISFKVCLSKIHTQNYRQMNDNEEQIKLLEAKLDRLLVKHNAFARELGELRKEIERLKAADNQPIEEETPILEEQLPVIAPSTETQEVNTPAIEQVQTSAPKPAAPKRIRTKRKSDLEKFIGENLINKIGIIITVIGVAIGAKYTIDNDLISPLTRIVLGYLVGLGLLGFGIKLKAKYTNYSAVLVSGAMAIMYFMTFAAYSFYGLIPQLLAFALMVAFTVFTVIAAVSYDRQVIAIIGLVGAYAVPFLLSTESGDMATLYSYMAMINAGILAVAVFRYWKPVYYAAFTLTWLIYAGWYAMDYQQATDFGTALTFLTVFFAIFYATFLAYKLLKSEKFDIVDIIFLLTNSFIFFGLGYSMLDGHPTWGKYLGLFALINALIHFVVSVVIYYKKLVDRNLFYVVSGLVLVFITMAIPIQLDGNWVTLLWAGEAALLFWIGRTKGVAIYEILSYFLMILAFASLLQDWESVYLNFFGSDSTTTPIFNIRFLSSVLFIAAFGFIFYLNNNEKYKSAIDERHGLTQLASYALAGILLFVIYMTFRLEISEYFNQLYTATTTKEPGQYRPANYSIQLFKTIWLAIYSLLFLTILSFLNIKIWKNKLSNQVNVGLNTGATIILLTSGLLASSQLRDNYLGGNLAKYYDVGSFAIAIRYIFLMAFIGFMYVFHQLVRQNYIKDLYPKFEILLHICIVWILSSELIHWMDMAHSTQSYKLGLSILWGVYSLIVVGLGIWQKKKYLRIAAIVLFAITLVKLFAYDIAHLNTISKTIVFVSLGVLLLIISFLYNKYSDSLIGDS